MKLVLNWSSCKAGCWRSWQSRFRVLFLAGMLLRPDASLVGSDKEQTVLAPYRRLYIMVWRYEPACFLLLVVGWLWLVGTLGIL
jgi:hypothetical protein